MDRSLFRPVTVSPALNMFLEGFCNAVNTIISEWHPRRFPVSLQEAPELSHHASSSGRGLEAELGLR